MLGIVPDKRDTSRLSCCITVTPDLDGLRVQVAKNEF
jgi:ferredoxin